MANVTDQDILNVINDYSKPVIDTLKQMESYSAPYWQGIINENYNLSTALENRTVEWIKGNVTAQDGKKNDEDYLYIPTVKKALLYTEKLYLRQFINKTMHDNLAGQETPIGQRLDEVIDIVLKREAVNPSSLDTNTLLGWYFNQKQNKEKQISPIGLQQTVKNTIDTMTLETSTIFQHVVLYETNMLDYFYERFKALFLEAPINMDGENSQIKLQMDNLLREYVADKMVHDDSIPVEKTLTLFVQYHVMSIKLSDKRENEWATILIPKTLDRDIYSDVVKILYVRIYNNDALSNVEKSVLDYCIRNKTDSYPYYKGRTSNHQFAVVCLNHYDEIKDEKWAQEIIYSLVNSPSQYSNINYKLVDKIVAENINVKNEENRASIGYALFSKMLFRNNKNINKDENVYEMYPLATETLEKNKDTIFRDNITLYSADGMKDILVGQFFSNYSGKHPHETQLVQDWLEFILSDDKELNNVKKGETQTVREAFDDSFRTALYRLPYFNGIEKTLGTPNVKKKKDELLKDIINDSVSVRILNDYQYKTGYSTTQYLPIDILQQMEAIGEENSTFNKDDIDKVVATLIDMKKTGIVGTAGDTGRLLKPTVGSLVNFYEDNFGDAKQVPDEFMNIFSDVLLDQNDYEIPDKYKQKILNNEINYNPIDDDYTEYLNKLSQYNKIQTLAKEYGFELPESNLTTKGTKKHLFANMLDELIKDENIMFKSTARYQHNISDDTKLTPEEENEILKESSLKDINKYFGSLGALRSMFYSQIQYGTTLHNVVVPFLSNEDYRKLVQDKNRQKILNFIVNNATYSPINKLPQLVIAYDAWLNAHNGEEPKEGLYKLSKWYNTGEGARDKIEENKQLDKYTGLKKEFMNTIADYSESNLQTAEPIVDKILKAIENQKQFFKPKTYKITVDNEVYTFKILDKKDPLGIVLGEQPLTGCCQKITGQGQSAMEAGYLYPDHSFVAVWGPDDKKLPSSQALTYYYDGEKINNDEDDFQAFYEEKEEEIYNQVSENFTAPFLDATEEPQISDAEEGENLYLIEVPIVYRGATNYTDDKMEMNLFYTIDKDKYKEIKGEFNPNQKKFFNEETNNQEDFWKTVLNEAMFYEYEVTKEFSIFSNKSEEIARHADGVVTGREEDNTFYGYDDEIGEAIGEQVSKTISEIYNNFVKKGGEYASGEHIIFDSIEMNIEKYKSDETADDERNTLRINKMVEKGILKIPKLEGEFQYKDKRDRLMEAWQKFSEILKQEYKTEGVWFGPEYSDFDLSKYDLKTSYDLLYPVGRRNHSEYSDAKDETVRLARLEYKGIVEYQTDLSNQVIKCDNVRLSNQEAEVIPEGLHFFFKQKRKKFKKKAKAHEGIIRGMYDFFKEKALENGITELDGLPIDEFMIKYVAAITWLNNISTSNYASVGKGNINRFNDLFKSLKFSEDMKEKFIKYYNQGNNEEQNRIVQIGRSIF